MMMHVMSLWCGKENTTQNHNCFATATLVAKL